MTWFAVYENATGRLESLGTVIAADGDLTSRGLSAKPLAFDPRVETKRWNAARREFNDVPARKAVLERRVFLARLSAAEREDIFDAARSHPNDAARKRLQAFLDWLKMVDAVDLGDDYVIAVIQGVEAVGLIGPGRAAEVIQ